MRGPARNAADGYKRVGSCTYSSSWKVPGYHSVAGSGASMLKAVRAALHRLVIQCTRWRVLRGGIPRECRKYPAAFGTGKTGRIRE